LIDEHVAKRKTALAQAKLERKDSAKVAETKPVESKQPTKQTTTPVVAAGKNKK
jgi:hypothetical protein